MKTTEERLHELPDAANEAFRDIRATDGLKYRVYTAAQNKGKRDNRLSLKRMVPVMACALAVVIGCVGMWRGQNGKTSVPTVSDTTGFRAAEYAAGSAVTDESVATVQLLSAVAAGQLPEGSKLSALDMNTGSVTVKKNTSSSRGNWTAAGDDGVPSITLNGACYRLLSSPSDASASLCGSALGTVGSGAKSNAVQDGETVYRVSDMKNACVMARVDGAWRLFQRVSQNGSALLGGETIGDVLLPARVTSVTLSGVGTVQGSDAQELVKLLTNGAAYIGNGMSERGDVLTFTFSNGVKLQAIVSDEKIMCCGTWACPEFLSRMAEMAK